MRRLVRLGVILAAATAASSCDSSGADGVPSSASTSGAAAEPSAAHPRTESDPGDPPRQAPTPRPPTTQGVTTGATATASSGVDLGVVLCSQVCRKTTRCGVETAAKNGASQEVRQRIAASEPDCLRACREDGPPADTDVPELRTCLQQDCGVFMTCLQRAMGQK